MTEFRFDPETWDWSRPIYDHVQLHVRDVATSVRFYEAVLDPLGIPLVYVYRGQQQDFRAAP